MNVPEFLYEVVLRPKPIRAITNAGLRAVVPKRKRLGDAWWIPNPNDPVISGGAALGVYERAGTAFFKKACKPGMTFLDIGANTGFYSAWAISLMRGSGRIVAFEPDPEAYKYLESTREANACSIMTTVQAAASEHEGTARLYKSEENKGDNRLYADKASTAGVDVQCKSVDAVLKSLGIRSANIVKIDVQGFEGHVLSGMKQTIQNSPEMTMMMEFWPWGLEQTGYSPEQILNMLHDFGFSIYELLGGGSLKPIGSEQDFIRALPGNAHTNIVCLRNNQAESELMDSE